jgi:hypothetical protein
MRGIAGACRDQRWVSSGEERRVVRNRIGGYLKRWTNVERELTRCRWRVVGMTESTESRMRPTSNERVEDGARFRRRPDLGLVFGLGVGKWKRRS